MTRLPSVIGTCDSSDSQTTLRFLMGLEVMPPQFSQRLKFLALNNFRKVHFIPSVLPERGSLYSSFIEKSS